VVIRKERSEIRERQSRPTLRFASCCYGRKNFSHFTSTSRASSGDSAEVGENLSRHANGRQASMVALGAIQF
jgi:hypothetical protein